METTKKDRNRYTPDMKHKAKELYMEYKTADAISKQTGIEVNSVIYYIKTQWKAERESQQSQTLVKINQAQSKEERISNMTEKGLAFLERSLNGLISTSESVPNDMKVVADIILKLKQIQALEVKSSPDVDKIKPASSEEIQDLINRDPFALPILE